MRTLLTAILLVAAATAAAGPAPSSSSSSSSLQATPLFRHYTIADGLPTSNIYTVAQDKKGVIWLGTLSGLARFDGDDFTVYKHDPGDPESLASDDVSAVVVDDANRLWAGGEGSGVNLLDRDTGSFRHFQHDPERDASLAGNDVMDMAAGRNGTLWVATYGHGLDHMTSPGHFEHLRHNEDDPDSLVSDNVLSLFQRGNSVWIGTDSGLDRRDSDGQLHHIDFEGVDIHQAIWNISGNDKEVRVATSKGLFRVKDGTARRMLADKLAAGAVSSSARDDAGNLWIGTPQGIILSHDGRIQHLYPQPLLPGGQPGEFIWDFHEDTEGGLWIATQNSGIAYLEPDWNRFSHYTHGPDDADSLEQRRVMTVATDASGKLWVGGGNKQLDALDPVTGEVTHHGDTLGPDIQRVHALATSDNGGLWLGSSNAVGFLHDGHVELADMPADSRGFGRILSTGNGTAFVHAIGHGMFRVDRNTLDVQRLHPAYDSNEDRQTEDLQLHADELWRASEASLSWLPLDADTFRPVSGVESGIINAMRIRGDELWLARPVGLEEYRLHDHQARLVQRVDGAAGWPGIRTNSLRIDADGRLWLFGNAGLWRFDPDSGAFTRYDRSDGLPNPEFTSPPQRSADGTTLFAGTSGGVIGFQPSTIVDHARPPPLLLEKVTVRRDGHDVSLPPDTDQLHLNWDDSDLRITAHALSFIDPDSINYRFRLDGLDDGWIDTGSRGTRELVGLGAGSYTLHVQAAGPDGAWGELATPLSIRVDAAPWTRPWAVALYILAGLLLVTLVIGIWKRRLHQHHAMQMAEQKRAFAEQANDAKSRFLATLSHEIRTPMTGLLGMAELLLRAPLATHEHECARTIHHNGELMLTLVNDSLDMARIEAGRLQLEPSATDLRALLANVRHLQSETARRKQLALEVQVDDDVPASLWADHLRLQQILLNLSGNALKFTKQGGVTLAASYADGMLNLSVTDTGPGISQDDQERLFGRFEQADGEDTRQGSGLGLAICRELVQLMDGRIELSSTTGAGSRFDLSLPLPATDKAANEPDAPASEADTTRGLQLLVVEDDPTSARTLMQLLAAQGHQPMHAADGLTGLSEASCHTYAAVLLDINLPDLDGLEVARMLRERHAHGDSVPIIGMTANTSTGESQAQAAGMNALVYKPITSDQLQRALRQVTPLPESETTGVATDTSG